MSSILGTHVKEREYLMNLFSDLQNTSRNMQENTHTHTLCIIVHTIVIHKYNLAMSREGTSNYDRAQFQSSLYVDLPFR